MSTTTAPTTTARMTTAPTITTPDARPQHCQTRPTVTGTTVTGTTTAAAVADVEVDPTRELPCQAYDGELWFAERPEDVERAKALCLGCPLQEQCLDGALERREPWGVWGGQLFLQGVVVARKRPRGRPRKDSAAA